MAPASVMPSIMVDEMTVDTGPSKGVANWACQAAPHGPRADFSERHTTPTKHGSVGRVSISSNELWVWVWVWVLYW